MASDISQIAQLLDATLDPVQHKKGTTSMPLYPAACTHIPALTLAIHNFSSNFDY